jgi:hypothetical protein
MKQFSEINSLAEFGERLYSTGVSSLLFETGFCIVALPETQSSCLCFSGISIYENMIALCDLRVDVFIRLVRIQREFRKKLVLPKISGWRVGKECWG